MAGGSYGAVYAALVRLYPRSYRERFGAEMALTFGDLCRERRAAGRGLLGLAAWVYFETIAGIIEEHAMQMTDLGRTIARAAAVALGMLMVPLVASRVVEGWNWNVGGFVFAYVLFFGTVLAYLLISRRMGAWAYKAGVGLALVTGFVLGWSNMVHTSESENPLNLLYFLVLVVGAVGAWVARLRARGLAWALFAMAGLLAVLSVALAGTAPAGFEERVAVGHWVGVGLFAAAGLLFRRASVAEGK